MPGDRRDEFLDALALAGDGEDDLRATVVLRYFLGFKTDEIADAYRSLLAGFDIPVNLLSVDTPLPPLITYRRTRTELRSTPTGGVIVREVEEEVG